MQDHKVVEAEAREGEDRGALEGQGWDAAAEGGRAENIHEAIFIF